MSSRGSAPRSPLRGKNESNILELGAPGRRSLARASRKRLSAARSLGVRAFTVKREGGSRGERVWLRPAHARGTKLSRGESALRFVLQKSNDFVTPKEAHIAIGDAGERGLAQSGRPRRANGRRMAGRGGKTAGSPTRKTDARKSIAGLSASSRWKASRVVEAVLSSRGGRGKRSRPSWSPSSRERDERTSEATGASEVGRSKINFRIHAPLRWRRPTAGSGSGSPKRVERRETHQAPTASGASSKVVGNRAK